jgi:ketosteroid isomerase-like protein
MSRENAEVRNEVVRTWLWAFENDTDAFRDILHPEFEWFAIDENRIPIHGVEAALRNREAWLDTWDEYRTDLEEVIEDGDDVVALVHITGKGRISGAAVDIRFYVQFKVRDGKVAYMFDHEDRSAALEAAGLRE